MASVRRSGTTIHVRFSRWEKVAGLLHDQDIPLTAVTRIDVVEDWRPVVHGLRVGFALPGIAAIGTYRRRGELVLVSVRRHRPALQIHLTGQRYESLLLDVDDPARTAAEVVQLS
jgi:hypothetical protein